MEILNKLQEQLPERQLKLANAGDGGLIRLLLTGLAAFLGGLLIFYFVYLAITEIMNDRKLQDNYVTVADAQVQGECKGARKFGYLVTCDVEIEHQGKHIEREFSFFDFSKDDYLVEVIAQKDNPENMNVDLAINKMTNRLMTFGLMAIVALLVFIWGVMVLKSIPKKQRLKAIMNEPNNQPWQFVAVSAEVDGDLITYSTEVDGKTIELDLDFTGRTPIVLGEEDEDKSLVLAIKAKNANSTVLLCNKFKNIDLTKAEKQALQAALASA